MKLKTKNLIGAALDWAVAKCEGVSYTGGYSPSTDWSQGGPIVEQCEIDLRVVTEGVWEASKVFEDLEFHSYLGGAPLVAAMRCHVASKLGNEADVPDELLLGEEVAEEEKEGV